MKKLIHSIFILFAISFVMVLFMVFVDSTLEIRSGSNSDFYHFLPTVFMYSLFVSLPTFFMLTAKSKRYYMINFALIVVTMFWVIVFSFPANGDAYEVKGNGMISFGWMFLIDLKITIFVAIVQLLFFFTLVYLDRHKKYTTIQKVGCWIFGIVILASIIFSILINVF